VKKLNLLILLVLLGCMFSTALAAEDFTIPKILDADPWRNAEDDRLLLASEHIYARSALQEKQMLKPLQVACVNLESFMDAGFTEAYPDIVVKHRPVYGHEAVSFFAEQINLQSDEIDIFEVPIGSSTQKAIDNGYYYPLNQSEPIREKMSSYRPFFRQVAMKGNDIAAIPRTAEQYTIAYSKYALAELGLTASDMPSTFMELMDFLLEWDKRVGDVAKQAEITPFGTSNEQIKADLFVMFMNQYYALMEKDESAVPLYEADMADLLDKLTLVCATIPEGTEEKPYGTLHEAFGHIKVNNRRSYLFSERGSFHPGRRSFFYFESVSDFIPIALTLPSQDAPVLFFEGTLFIVNPYSSQKEQAIQWLTYYMNHLPAKDAAAFDRGELPLESELYIAMKEYYTSEMERLETRIEAAKGTVKSDLEAELQMRQDRLCGLEQIKWEVSAQGLADYEWILAHSTVLWNDPYLYSDSFVPTGGKYFAEGLPGKKVAQEIFAAYEMILKESR